MTVYAGIDYSMSSPSICVWDSNTPLKFENCLIYNFGNWSRCKQFEGDHGNISILKQPTFSCNEERFLAISQWAKAVLMQNCVDKASLEDYSYGSKGSVFEIGENTGMLKQAMYSLKIPFIPLAPGNIKKIATGNGAAKKDLMYKFFKEQESVSIEKILGYTTEVWKEKLIETPWEVKPIDDIIDSFYVLKSHPDLKVIV